MCPVPHVAADDRHAPPLAARMTKGVSSLVRKAWRAYSERRASRTTIAVLHTLDDPTLRDIGISGSEIESLVQRGSNRRRRYDATWPWRA
jgi:uncharacterized protein YjiS (DUF1127 family)